MIQLRFAFGTVSMSRILRRPGGNVKPGRNAAGRFTRQGGKGRPFKPGFDPNRNTAGQRSKVAVETTRKIRAEVVAELDREGSYKIKMPDGKERVFRARNYELLARVIVRQALSGDFQFVNLVLDRVEGKVPQPLQGGEDERPVLIRIMPAVAKR